MSVCSSQQPCSVGRAAPRTGRRRPPSTDFRWDTNHAWSSHPSLYLAGVAKAKPLAAAAARLGLALLSVSSELKAASAELLDLVNDPQYADMAVQNTLRSALHYCEKVHCEEVLPGARLFTLSNGARPEDWEAAFSKTPRPRTHDDANGGNPLESANESEIEALPSMSQRALLRSLQAATDLGAVPARDLRDGLGASFLACNALRNHAATLAGKGAVGSLAWEQGLLRRHTEACGGDPSLVEGHEPLPPGPILCMKAEEIAALASPQYGHRFIAFRKNDATAHGAITHGATTWLRGTPHCPRHKPCDASSPSPRIGSPPAQVVTPAVPSSPSSSTTPPQPHSPPRRPRLAPHRHVTGRSSTIRIEESVLAASAPSGWQAPCQSADRPASAPATRHLHFPSSRPQTHRATGLYQDQLQQTPRGAVKARPSTAIMRQACRQLAPRPSSAPRAR